MVCGVCPSFRLSVPSIDRCSSVRRVCCCYPDGQEMSTDCCTASVHSNGAAAARRTAARRSCSSKREQCHVYSRCRMLNTDLFMTEKNDRIRLNNALETFGDRTSPDHLGELTRGITVVHSILLSLWRRWLELIAPQVLCVCPSVGK